MLEGKTMKSLRMFLAGALLIAGYVVVAYSAAKTVTVEGYVLDSA